MKGLVCLFRGVISACGGIYLVSTFTFMVVCVPILKAIPTGGFSVGSYLRAPPRVLSNGDVKAAIRWESVGQVGLLHSSSLTAFT